MEGHLEVPVDGESIYAELQKNWVQKYFRTRDGRLQWFAVSYFFHCTEKQRSSWYPRNTWTEVLTQTPEIFKV